MFPQVFRFLPKSAGAQRFLRCFSSDPGMYSDLVQPLAGVTVVALEQAVAAPYVTSRLADSGARVIKIERNDDKGDFARGYDQFAGGLSSYFVWLNRGKESIQLDLKCKEDLELLENIVSSADVFVQNFAPGATDRMGFGSKTLQERYPRLITVDISGYGNADESLQHRKAYDMLVQAESGLSDISGVDGIPSRVGVSICDICCGMYAHAGVLEALASREKTGKGVAIEVSLFSAIADWLTVPLSHFEHDQVGPSGIGLNHPSVHPYGVYGTKGGDRILIAVQNEREFESLCNEVLERPDLPSDPLFSNNVNRCANRGALDKIISGNFSDWNIEDLISKLEEANIAFANVNGMKGLSAHQALEKVDVNTEKGVRTVVAPAVKFNGKHRPLRRVPALGEHSKGIREEFSR